MEPPDQLAARIGEDAQENKLRLVGEVADRVWGRVAADPVKET